MQGDIANDITVNSNGVVFVTGISDIDATTSTRNTITTIAYNNTNGAQNWIHIYSFGTNIAAEANALAATPSGCASTGFVQTANAKSDALVVDYNSTGSNQWYFAYNGIGNNNENIHSIVVDNTNNVFACGYIVESDQDRNMAMMKFDAQGNFACQKTVDGTSSGSTDDANGIV